MSTQRERIKRSLERMDEREAKEEQRRAASKAASDRLFQLFETWNEQTDCSQRTFNRVKKEVLTLLKEIEKGKVEQIDERFAQVVERATAQTLPKKRATYLQTVTALKTVCALSEAWYKEQVRSKQEQAAMLRGVRRLLLEIEAGYLDDLAERFQQIALALSTSLDEEASTTEEGR